MTPAPVPTGTERQDPTGQSGAGNCPELPSNAEVYVCSPERGDRDRLRLVRIRGPGTDHTDGPVFALTNGTSVVFRTGRDWWTLATLEGAEWSTAGQGAGRDRLSVGPGRRVLWRLSGDSVAEDSETIEVEAELDPDGQLHAFVVTGYVAGGELTAVIAPFRPSRS